jgi:hypothetical protein
MRRLLVIVAVVTVLGGCGIVAEDDGPPDTGPTVDQQSLWDQQAQQGQEAQEEWERQMAQTADDYAPSPTTTTLDARELLCAESADCSR